jgi:hypothetical protein
MGNHFDSDPKLGAEEPSDARRRSLPINGAMASSGLEAGFWEVDHYRTISVGFQASEEAGEKVEKVIIFVLGKLDLPA